MRQSKRGQVEPFIAMDVLRMAAEAEAAGRDIVHMEVGQPSTSAPKAAKRRLAEALEHQPMGYTVALGLPYLREGIARLYKRWYNVDLDPARVVITSGSSGAFQLAFTALFDAGDKVGLGEPGYPSYRQILKALSIEPVGIPTEAQNRYQPTPEEIPDDLQGLIVASPGNPSGTMLGKPELEALIEHCAARDIAFISDEIYHGLQYDARAVSALEITDDVFVINSFSKYFSMTGWRVGWMVVPESHLRTVERLAQHMFICAPHASQVAALGALESIEEMEGHVSRYAESRALLLEELPKMGFTRIAPPDGAFYLYADVSELTEDSAAFAAEILESVGVAVTPGMDFDPHRGKQTIRISYAQSPERVAEGVRRLREFMAKRNG
ncbi:MAG: aminotransferase class I/II-fold pyridoxal phosphate-dependent enzyme [Thioclava marina]|uniref:pyridoxal phosphate-dependent aminotransferase n=1 Tax=Thioclava marina TaxID=1915077 RepID=UPI00199B0062|nr:MULTISPECIES: aminotransferase class I/II-fold pyridoxal phosphate-dependent enzyme [Thioclava]MBC7147511.1 aminotransferase class I/II-fold pyridoxal phosphate-dependent enzyme [Thioclava marina]MBD3803468.1 aminotransferase class I/II-fold pyridoxal phosphate-dependent enzyme [Thioclava sp.]